MAKKRREFLVYIAGKTEKEIAKWEAEATKANAFITWLPGTPPSADDTAKELY